jgi:formylglycine-generating enzyme required for sulfatase activity
MDLVGNASEWVFDWYNWGDYSQMPTWNPVNLEPPWNHCVRGSAWHDPAGDIDQVSVWSLCSTRSSAHSIADPRTGFRCARSVLEEE